MNWFWPRRTNGLSYGPQSAGMPCFVQYNGVLRFREVWKVVGSCFRPVEEDGMCSQCLLRLVLTKMCVVVQYAKFLLCEARKCQVVFLACTGLQSMLHTLALISVLCPLTCAKSICIVLQRFQS